MKRWFWVLDAAVVISFAIIGAADHGFTIDVAWVMRVSLPFLIALALGIAALRVWKNPLLILNGILLALITLAVGMLLRHYVWDDGTAQVFVIVTGAYFVAVIVGWRVIGLGVRRFRTRS